MNKNKLHEKGITLVALVLTIIVLLILAGISIQALTNTGIFGQAQNAKKESEIANIKEQIQMKIYQAQLFNAGNISDQELKTILDSYGTIQYEADNVTIKGIITSKGYEIPLTDLNSIKTTAETILSNGKWQKGKGVNSPQLLTGMTPIKFTDPTDSAEGAPVEIPIANLDGTWYSYIGKKWANAKTQDGSMWVWIPRFAYKINTSTKTCDIVFLINDTDNYYDENGQLQTAKRQKTVDQTVDTTTGYTVHPAFTNETSIKYANGGWKKELAGIWVSKFEAGYASGNNTATVKASTVKYTRDSFYGPSGWATARNWIDGTYGSTETNIKYPTFQGLTYSMNYISHSDAYSISQALTESNNIYGLNSTNADSHLMKNSEWGAVAYLSQSKYGLNGTNIYINNVTLNNDNSTPNVYAVTGCCGATADAGKVGTTIAAINARTATNVYTWTQKNGQKASSTGTIYGIYDMSGGTWERSAGLVANGHENLTKYGNALISAVTKTAGETTTYESIEYVTVYPSNDAGETNLDEANKKNYAVNTKIYGDAVRETSTAGTGSTSWYSDYSYFPGYGDPFFARGGNLWDRAGAGLFYFYRDNGGSRYTNGFRAVLVAQ